MLQTALIEKEIELQSFRVKRNAGIDMHADPARITVNMWLVSSYIHYSGA